MIYLLQAKKMMDNGSLKPSDLSKICLSRIENLKELNAFICIIRDKAMEEAFESDERYQNGENHLPYFGTQFSKLNYICLTFPISVSLPIFLNLFFV